MSEEHIITKTIGNSHNIWNVQRARTKNKINLSETAINQVDETMKNGSYKYLHPSFKYLNKNSIYNSDNEYKNNQK